MSLDPSLAPGTTPGVARFPGPAGESRFDDPVATVAAYCLAEVAPALAELARATARGQWVAGFVAYEAAPAFDPSLGTHPPTPGLPLLWFGVYDACEHNIATRSAPKPYTLGPWQPSIEPAAYHAGIERIRDLIAAGDTYQVNYTFPMFADFTGEPEAWFEDLREAQRADHCAYIDTGRHAIVSASPELFFSLEGDRIRTRPMKGTSPRGRWVAEDRALGAALLDSAKNRAENVMIVDLLRNDLGRIAQTGSVSVVSLFDLERYPTVWQLTSAIEARTTASWAEVLAVLFPSGSVTGAPKIRTMQIIREIEPHPRGVYCGAIGWAGPDGRAEFNVAIRTATIDHETGRAVYPVGGGITWDSAAEAEYAECTHKARILTHRRPSFELIETMLFEGGACALLERHLERLTASADYFGFPLERDAALEALAAATDGRGEPARVRLTLNARGEIRVETAPIPEPREFRVAWGHEPVDERDIFLYHKTSERAVYERARAAAPDADDVLLVNSRGEVTEGCIGNLVVELEGRRYTPPVECGLLEGVFRAELLAQRQIETRILTPKEVDASSKRWLVNALRGWIPIGRLS